jgi:hypothetical protein
MQAPAGQTVKPAWRRLAKIRDNPVRSFPSLPPPRGPIAEYCWKIGSLRQVCCPRPQACLTLCLPIPSQGASRGILPRPASSVPSGYRPDLLTGFRFPPRLHRQVDRLETSSVEIKRGLVLPEGWPSLIWPSLMNAGDRRVCARCASCRQPRSGSSPRGHI